MDGIKCDGTEKHVGECSHGGWGVHDCTHAEDVAVSCVVDSPITRTTSPTPTVKPNGAAIQGGNRKYATSIAAATVVGGLIIFCACIVIMNYCRRNRDHKEPAAIPSSLMHCSTVRPPPTALAVRNKPPTYEESFRRKPTHTVRLSDSC